MGPHGPNVATELEAALAADLSGGSGGRSPPSYPPMGPQGPLGDLLAPSGEAWKSLGGLSWPDAALEAHKA